MGPVGRWRLCRLDQYPGQGDDPGEVPEQPHIQFAFVYQGKDGAMISIDNVIVYADLVEDYAAITACAR